MMKKLSFAVFIGCFSGLVMANNTGLRNVVEVGCHRAEGTCFVTLDGPAVGVAGCISNSIRWNSQADVNGKNWLALLMMANATGKKVNLYTDSCYTGTPYPTFGWGAVAQ